MNRKGFTLIELIAVIVVLAIILTISIPSLTNVFKKSKLKNEEIFANRLSQTIDSYLTLNGGTLTYTSFGTAGKDLGRGNTYSVDVYRAEITVEDLFSDKLITKDDYINPGNKKVACKEDAQIEIYRDSDYVYCHKIKKEALDCLSSEFKETITGDYVVDTCTWKQSAGE